MIVHLHAKAGALALATIVCFWLATVGSEISGDGEWILIAKTGILWGFLVLIPAIIVAAATGRRLARHSGGAGLGRSKRRRMPAIAANGVLILVPAAVFLRMAAADGQFDATFFVVQGVELLAGAANAALLYLNLRDGRALLKSRADAGYADARSMA